MLYAEWHACAVFAPARLCSGWPTFAPDLIDFSILHAHTAAARLLIFSGAGFLIENLWDSRKVYDTFSFASIWAVFIVNVVAGELLPQFGLLLAIVVGIILSAFEFSFRFAKDI